MGSCELVSVCVRVRVCVGHQLLWLLQLAGYKLQAMKAPRLSCGESFFFNFIGKSIRWLQIVFGCWSALNLFDFTDRPTERAFLQMNAKTF